jgi:hypothetical protein
VRNNTETKENVKMKSRMFKIPMQFFADGANDDDKNKNGQNDDGQNGQNNNGQQNDDSNKSGNNGNAGEGKKDEKTFNQEQVNKMMAKEKNQGRNAVYNELGINPKDEKQIEAIKAYIESQKSDTQKATEKALAEEKALKEAEDRVRIAEAKAEVMMLGIKTQFVDDAVTLALAKTSEDRDIKSVLAEFKTKYPVWFETEEDKKKQAKGTGSSLKNQSGKNDKGEEKGIGARLAAQRKSSKTKSSYWSTK